MKFSDSDITGFLSAMGDSVIINSVSYPCLFLTSGEPVTRDGITFVTTEPVVTVADSTAALVTINDTVMTIDSISYQAYRKTPLGNGLTELDLTKDY